MDTSYINESVMPENGTKKNKNKFIIIIIVFILLALISVCFFIFGDKGRSLDDYLDLGDKYLEEANFDDALASYDKALEIDDMCVEAYLGKIEVYIRTEKIDEALEVAKEGYDKTGDELLKEKIDMLESGNIFDSIGRVFKETYYDENGNVEWYHEFSYKGNMVEPSYVVHKDSNGNIIAQIEAEFNEKNQAEVSYDGYTSDGGYLIKSENNFDGDKVVHATKTTMNPDDMSTSEEEYKYDGDHLVEQTVIHSDGSVYTMKIIYDSNGNIIRDEYYTDGEKTSYCTFELDVNGNHTKQIFYNIDIETGEESISSQYEYEYDSEGNMISCREYDSEGNFVGETVMN